MLKNIVDRAKTRAVKESIETGLDVALTVPLLAAAVEDEYRETRDSMADVDPEQWSRINGMDPIRRATYVCASYKSGKYAISIPARWS